MQVDQRRHETLRVPIVMPAHAAASSIQPATTMTTPGATST